MNIYVGNLPVGTTEDDITEAFKAYGEVMSVSLIKDKYSGELRGFGFVEMPSKEAAQEAINGLNGTELNGQEIIVNEARPRNEGGGGRRGGGGGGSRGGGGRRY